VRVGDTSFFAADKLLSAGLPKEIRAVRRQVPGPRPGGPVHRDGREPRPRRVHRSAGRQDLPVRRQAVLAAHPRDRQAKRDLERVVQAGLAAFSTRTSRPTCTRSCAMTRGSGGEPVSRLAVGRRSFRSFAERRVGSRMRRWLPVLAFALLAPSIVVTGGVAAATRAAAPPRRYQQ